MSESDKHALGQYRLFEQGRRWGKSALSADAAFAWLRARQAHLELVEAGLWKATRDEAKDEANEREEENQE